MLEPIRHILNTKRIILASSSPRRCEILQNIGLKFEVVPSKYEENLRPETFKNHGDYAVATAFNKVMDIDNQLSKDSVTPDIIIGADTVVSFYGKLLGKPKDKTEAFQYLKELAGKQHTVFTGVVIKTKDETKTFYESTKVFMAPLNDKTIQGYVDTDEPLDKAGAYGIQGLGASIIEKIDGDYFNVMGLPLHSICKQLVTIYK